MSLSFHDVLPLHLADITFPEWHPLRGQTGEVLAFALRHPTGLILFETGIGSGSELVDQLYEISRRDIDVALGAHGHGLSDVRIIVNSHLHFDHCGNNLRFPGVPIYVQTAEYDAAHQPQYTVPEWIDFDGAEYVVINGDGRVARAAYGCCPRRVTHQVTNPWCSIPRTASWRSQAKRSTPRPSTSTYKPRAPCPATTRHPIQSDTSPRPLG